MPESTYNPKLYARTLRNMAKIMRGAEPVPDVVVHADIMPPAVPILYVHGTPRSSAGAEPAELVALARRLSPIPAAWKLRGGMPANGSVVHLGRHTLDIEVRLFIGPDAVASFLEAGATEVDA